MHKFQVVALTFLVALSASLTVGAHPNPPGCEDKLKAVAFAQTKHNKALAFWRQMDARVRNQENKIKFLERQLADNFKKTGAALSKLDAAKADQAACDAFESDPINNLPPLCDCSQVPGRVQTAENEVADLEAMGSELNSDLDKAEAELEAFEAARADAHAEERATAAALEEAKAAAAGCHIHA